MTNLLDQFPQPMSDADSQAILQERGFETVALGHMRESVRYARKCCRGSFTDAELVSLCYPALLQAAENYKARHGISFFAFAKQYLRGAISREWRGRDIVRNSSRHRGEKPAMIADKTSWDDTGEDNHKPPVVVPVVLPDFEALDLQERWAIVWPVMQRRLNDVERMVLVLRYKSGFSFEEIAKLRNVTRQAIQRTHAQCLKKLCCALAHKKALL